MNQLNRIDFMDVLRAFIIFLVIIMHTALAFLGFPNWVHNPEPGGLLGIIVIFAESGLWMPILFFVSGYFALSSLQKHGSQEFIKDKLLRLGLPFLVGLVLLSPILWLMGYTSDGGSLPPAQALASFFTLKNFGQFHFWYLGVLLLYFLLLTIASKRFPAILKARPVTARPPSARFFIALIAITSTLCFAVNLFTPYSDWTCIGILQFQSVKVPLYNTYFLLGIFAYLKGWFKEGYHPRLLPWALIYILSFVFYLGLVDRFSATPPSVLGKLLLNTTACIEVLSALLTYTALFQKLLNANRPALRSITSLSFAAYIVHLNVLFVVVLLTRDLALPLLLKYAIQAGATVLISWGLSAIYRQISAASKEWSLHLPRVLLRR